jgi:hypothetical protein
VPRRSALVRQIVWCTLLRLVSAIFVSCTGVASLCSASFPRIVWCGVLCIVFAISGILCHYREFRRRNSRIWWHLDEILSKLKICVRYPCNRHRDNYRRIDTLLSVTAFRSSFSLSYLLLGLDVATLSVGLTALYPTPSFDVTDVRFGCVSL